MKLERTIVYQSRARALLEDDGQGRIELTAAMEYAPGRTCAVTVQAEPTDAAPVLQALAALRDQYADTIAVTLDRQCAVARHQAAIRGELKSVA